MKLRLAALLPIVALLSPVCSHAASVISATTDQVPDLVGGTAKGIFGTDNNPIAFGAGSISVGYFTSVPNFSTTDGTGVAAAFNQLGTTGQFNGLTGNPVNGLYDHNASAAIITSGTNSNFIGQNIIIVIGNGLTIGSSNALLVLQSTTQFAADAPAFSTSISLQSGAGLTVLHGSNTFDGRAPGSGGSAAAPLINLSGTDYYASANSYKLGALNTVPEPSAMLLGAFGSLLVLRRRRA